MGHSMGGGATILSVSNYDLGYKFKYEFDAGFTYSGCDPAPDVNKAVKLIDKPFFLMTATHDCICPPKEYSEKYYTEIPNNKACKYLGDITKGDHCNWEDTVDIYQCQALENSECPEDKNDITPKQQQDIGIAYTKLFLNAIINKSYYTQITAQLQADLKNGTMADVSIGNEC